MYSADNVVLAWCGLCYLWYFTTTIKSFHWSRLARSDGGANANVRFTHRKDVDFIKTFVYLKKSVTLVCRLWPLTRRWLPMASFCSVIYSQDAQLPSVTIYIFFCVFESIWKYFKSPMAPSSPIALTSPLCRHYRFHTRATVSSCVYIDLD